MSKFCVRLKPYDPNGGNLLRDFSVSGWDMKFKAGVWYDIDNEAAAEYLRTQVYRKVQDPFSGPAFDVCTPEQAADLIRREESARQGKMVDPIARLAYPLPELSVKATPNPRLNSPHPEHELTAAHRPAGQAETWDEIAGDAPLAAPDAPRAGVAAEPLPLPRQGGRRVQATAQAPRQRKPGRPEVG